MTAEPRQGGCREDKGCLGAVVGFYEMLTARAHMAAPVSTGSPWHREDVLVPKSHRMYGGMVQEYTTFRGGVVGLILSGCTLYASVLFPAPELIGLLMDL